MGANVLSTMLQSASELPKSVQRAFISVLVAWTAHFFTTYLYLLKESVPLQQVVVGIMLFSALLFVKKWGRFICIFFTGWAIIWYLRFIVSFFAVERLDIVAVLIGNCILFALSIFFLMQKDTVRYFAKRAQEDKEKMERRAQKSNRTPPGQFPSKAKKKNVSRKKKQKKR